MIGVAGWLTYGVWRDLNALRSDSPIVEMAEAAIPASEEVAPQYEPLALNAVLDWSAEDAPDEVIRQAGPFVVKITKKDDSSLVAPLVTVMSASQSITMEGSQASPGFEHKIMFIQNRTVSGPAVMLQSFSGGAHCCNRIQVAGFVRDKLSVVDLGSWDGDYIDVPTDISREGIVDFVMNDNSFLYAFASYADSYAPPKVLNIVNGKVIDVSRHSAFRSLFERRMKEAAERCRPRHGMGANGACPAFIAAAARVGRLERAWPQMLAAYDATADWDLPTGCRVSADDGCPDGEEIVYKSYPEALLAFLKRHGYVPQNWLPPEAFQQSNDDAPAESTDYVS